MADKQTAASGDTDFRRTWDKAEYAQRAKEREATQRAEGKARYEAKLQGKKYHGRAKTPPDVHDTSARSQRIDVGAMVGKTMLVPASAAVGKRGRGAGFYCEACDLTFKDNLQLVEHYNSGQHLRATGESGSVKVASREEVRERLLWLWRKRVGEGAETVDLKERIRRAGVREEAERERRRRKRNEKRRRKGRGGEESKESG